MVEKEKHNTIRLAFVELNLVGRHIQKVLLTGRKDG